MSPKLYAPIALIALIIASQIWHFEIDATFIAFCALIIFFGVLIQLGVPGMVAGMLDTKSADIAKELADAKALKEQAAALLAEYEGKKAAAEAQASEIIAQAKVQAEALAAETKVAMSELLARHEKSAGEKIARAEAQALAEVRAAAVDAAVDAAEKVLKRDLNAAGQSTLVERGVSDLARNFS
jgi:F-type H+-transporting ATPase subunit b